ncbi:hypothetical protein O181_072180 [Austropuccinia psidii MF-1]|uniref:Uncharacterized protein n=1 Tax=Austropuccinia psidii MF-1 TaxID=1389203 RepID=A0A9Q3IAS1_9BASI|nr:hypothetical protein [Austropuccinia psidii MF-1]
MAKDGPNHSSKESEDCKPLSPSPHNVKFKESITGFVHRVRDAVSHAVATEDHSSHANERGRSSNRDSSRPTSTGRGGAGNMVPTRSTERAVIAERLDNREGERILQATTNRSVSLGRGGAGNIHTLNSDLKQSTEEREKLRILEDQEIQIHAEYGRSSKLEPISTGRGGAAFLTT